MQQCGYAQVALVLQGGGALGAYQAGAYQALSDAGYEPDWVCGISIGAINAAIIAGNKPEDRLPRLKQFWKQTTSAFPWPAPDWSDTARRFGDYTESGQVIPVRFGSETGGYSHAMYLNDGPPIFGGRELWGFPKKYAQPALKVHKDTLVGTLDYGPVRVATGTMGFKHWTCDHDAALTSLSKPSFLLKIVPHVDGSPRICEIVRYQLEDVTLKGAWGGPAALDVRPHALAPVAELPVLEVVSAIHLIADLTLGLGTVVHDYLAQAEVS